MDTFLRQTDCRSQSSGWLRPTSIILPRRCKSFEYVTRAGKGTSLGPLQRAFSRFKRASLSVCCVRLPVVLPAAGQGRPMKLATEWRADGPRRSVGPQTPHPFELAELRQCDIAAMTRGAPRSETARTPSSDRENGAHPCNSVRISRNTTVATSFTPPFSPTQVSTNSMSLQRHTGEAAAEHSDGLSCDSPSAQPALAYPPRESGASPPAEIRTSVDAHGGDPATDARAPSPSSETATRQRSALQRPPNSPREEIAPAGPSPRRRSLTLQSIRRLWRFGVTASTMPPQRDMQSSPTEAGASPALFSTRGARPRAVVRAHSEPAELSRSFASERVYVGWDVGQYDGERAESATRQQCNPRPDASAVTAAVNSGHGSYALFGGQPTSVEQQPLQRDAQENLAARATLLSTSTAEAVDSFGRARPDAPLQGIQFPFHDDSCEMEEVGTSLCLRFVDSHSEREPDVRRDSLQCQRRQQHQQHQQHLQQQRAQNFGQRHSHGLHAEEEDSCVADDVLQQEHEMRLLLKQIRSKQQKQQQQDELRAFMREVLEIEREERKQQSWRKRRREMKLQL